MSDELADLGRRVDAVALDVAAFAARCADHDSAAHERHQGGPA